MMVQNRINLCLARMSEDGLEQKFVKEAFETNWVAPLGPNVNAFEIELEKFFGQQKAIVALSAGTAAIHLALLACGVGKGDEVCVQSFTFCASSNPIVYLGAVPVFVDSEKESWNMDSTLLEKAIVDRKAKTGKFPKAIIPVALYGMPYQVDKIFAVAEKYGIPVIEDTAEGFGSKWGDRPLGTFGKFGVLSFNGNKMITTSGGGALICDKSGLKEKILWYATQARDSYPYYHHSAIGFNYRMSNICAGIGRGQMAVAAAHIAHHKHVQSLYESLLGEVPGITVHSQPVDGKSDSNYWLCTILLDSALKIKGQDNVYEEVIRNAIGGASGVLNQADSPVTGCQPNENVEALRIFLDKEKNIEARPVWKPMHKQPVYCNGAIETSSGVLEGPGMIAYVNGISETIFKHAMCLPAGPWVSDDDVRFIVESIKEAIESN